MPDSQSSSCLEHALPYPADSIELYRRVRHLPLPVLLTSGKNKVLSGRYDVITAAPEKILRTCGTCTTVVESDGSSSAYDDNPVQILKREFESSSQGLIKESLPKMFPGGAIGYFAYELLHPWYGITSSTEDDIALPSMLAGIYQWSLVIDHDQETCKLILLPGCSQQLAEELLVLFKSPVQEAQESGFSLQSGFQSNFTPGEYQAAFRNVIDYIHAGDCYQVNLAQRFSAPYQGDALQAFSHLHVLANAPFSACIQHEENGQPCAVLSFSPERFIRVNDLEVLTQPIKGTRPRSSDPVKDKALLDELLGSKKDQAENLMIVDLLRNDLGRVCQTGSVEVPALFEAQSFNNVHHLVSTVTGKLNKASDVFDLFGASFPGGSITGAPKLRSMEIINELETRPRSVYCGSIAYFGFNGNMDSNICIRTLVCSQQQIHCWGGGGVVADSVGEQEYQETFDKISMFIDNLPVA